MQFFFYLAALGLSCGMQDLVLSPGIEPRPLHWEHSLSHRTTKKVPLVFKINLSFFSLLAAYENLLSWPGIKPMPCAVNRGRKFHHLFLTVNISLGLQSYMGFESFTHNPFISQTLVLYWNFTECHIFQEYIYHSIAEMPVLMDLLKMIG